MTPRRFSLFNDPCTAADASALPQTRLFQWCAGVRSCKVIGKIPDHVATFKKTCFTNEYSIYKFDYFNFLDYKIKMFSTRTLESIQSRYIKPCKLYSHQHCSPIAICKQRSFGKKRILNFICNKNYCNALAVCHSSFTANVFFQWNIVAVTYSVLYCIKR